MTPNDELRKPREEAAIVLDYLPNGYPFENKPAHLKSPVAQAVGKTRFVLLELVPRTGTALQPLEEVYIGEGKRDKIHHIQGRLAFERLTHTARAELEFVLKDIVQKEEARFVEFFNKAQPLSTRMHSLELLPGMGKKRMWEIVNERKIRPFSSFQDMQDRIKLMPDPRKVIISRILEELQGLDKHSIFVERAAPPRE
ncbi:DUF655 domain-containing protein [Candidatus Woesearchaeota archaeon]|nr:DUF655 domain-containing protein [Candidatus Woesearchaeota archaeon]